MGLGKRVRQRLLQRVLPMPFAGGDPEYSVISAVDDVGVPPTPRLITLALEAIKHSQTITLEDVRANRRYPLQDLSVWPSSYRLLAGLVTVLQPRLVIEIGTSGGNSALAIKRALPAQGRIVTFDIHDWRQAHQPVLEERDFADGRLKQEVADLSHTATFDTYRALFEAADFIFLDAAKDGVLEQRLLDLLATVTFRQPPVLLFDDTRTWNMLKTWREIRRPKLDITSFGHWRGNGLVDWQHITHP